MWKFICIRWQQTLLFNQFTACKKCMQSSHRQIAKAAQTFLPDHMFCGFYFNCLRDQREAYESWKKRRKQTETHMLRKQSFWFEALRRKQFWERCGLLIAKQMWTTYKSISIDFVISVVHCLELEAGEQQTHAMPNNLDDIVSL